MKVNIVMLVKDRPKLTWQCLRSLAENTPKELYNLTIVNDASRPEMSETLREIAAKSTHVALLENVTSRGITGQARNLGVYWAERYWGRGEWLYLSDNDVYFTRSWLERLVTEFENYGPTYGYKLIGGWNHPFLQPNEMQPHLSVKINAHDAVTGASQLMKWATWDKYGPLDAHAKGVGQSEDWKFCQDIIKDGRLVGSIYPRVVLNCGVTNSFGEPSPGAAVMIRELKAAKPMYPDLYWE